MGGTPLCRRAVCRHRVARLMRGTGLQSVPQRRHWRRKAYGLPPGRDIELFGTVLHRHWAYQQLGVTLRNEQRWTWHGMLQTDARLTQQNRMSRNERAQAWAVCHESVDAGLPQIHLVPRLGDQGQYIAMESIFYCVLRTDDMQDDRGQSRPPQQTRPCVIDAAHEPRQVWPWDITWLPGPAKGLFFFLYLIRDLCSRKIVGWEVFEQESSEHAATVVQHAVLAEASPHRLRILHAENGSPMRGVTFRATLERLSTVASYGRPRVSNDNPFSEALLRIHEYRLAYPAQGFATLETTRTWGLAFVCRHDDEHRHRGIRFVVSTARHAGHGWSILQQRHGLYEQARLCYSGALVLPDGELDAGRHGLD